MAADRLLGDVNPDDTAARSAVLAAERRRVAALVTHLADGVLESRQSLVGHADVKWFLGRMAQELTVLLGVVRDGGTVADLEQKLVSLNVKPAAPPGPTA